MKRISILTLMFVVLLSCTAFAANWAWIDSNDKIGFFFDSNTIKYASYHDIHSNKTIPIKNTICFWQKTIYTPEAANQAADKTGLEEWRNVSYVIEYVILDKQNKCLSTNYSTFYDHDGNVIEQSAATHTSRVIPDTMGESVYEVITTYAKNNDSSLERNPTH